MWCREWHTAVTESVFTRWIMQSTNWTDEQWTHETHNSARCFQFTCSFSLFGCNVNATIASARSFTQDITYGFVVFCCCAIIHCWLRCRWVEWMRSWAVSRLAVLAMNARIFFSKYNICEIQMKLWKIQFDSKSNYDGLFEWLSIAQRRGPLLLNVIERTHLNRESCLLFVLTQYAALTLIYPPNGVATSQIATVEPYTPTSLIETTETYTTHINRLESEKQNFIFEIRSLTISWSKVSSSENIWQTKKSSERTDSNVQGYTTRNCVGENRLKRKI